jgi:hypothetical protein
MLLCLVLGVFPSLVLDPAKDGMQKVAAITARARSRAGLAQARTQPAARAEAGSGRGE